MLWISIALTAALFALAGVCFATWRGNSKLPPVLITLLAVPLFLILMLIALDFTASLFSGFLLIIAAVFESTRNTRQFLIRAAYGVCLVYGVVSIHSLYSLYPRYAWRMAHPLESITDRTASRRQPTPLLVGWEAAQASRDAAKPGEKNPKTIFSAFESQTERKSTFQRYRAIHALHRGYVDLFVDSFGFGHRRMSTIEQRPERYVGKDPLPTVSQPGQRPTVDSGTPEVAKPTRPAGPPPQIPGQDQGANPLVPDGDDLAALHLDSLLDFFDMNDFGFVKSVNEVSGFRPHHFKKLPEPSDVAEPENTSLNWSVERLELVGLLLHEEPVVYVSDNLPKMRPGADMPTRPLDAFENDALRRLEAGEEIATLQDGDHHRVLGAIRAAKECLKCHQVNRGDLLGAFLYRLRREPPFPVGKKEPGPKT